MDIFPGISALIAANLVIRQVLETGGGEQGVLGILFLKSQTEALQRIRGLAVSRTWDIMG